MFLHNDEELFKDVIIAASVDQKCHHVIDRFSEDIDITFSNTLTQKVELTLCR